MKKIAITIPTFLRFHKVKKEILSIQKEYSSIDYKLYIGEQGEPNLKKNQFYNGLIKKGHEIYQLPFNCGAIYSRNYIIKKTQEPYILVIDNDFLFNVQSKLDPFLEVLEESPHVGIVGGIVNNRIGHNINYTYDFVKKDGKLYFIYNNDKKWFKTMKNHYRYMPSHMVLNFFLAKREVFEDILWDEKFLMFGHIDFFLRMKETKWKVAYCPEVEVYHQSELDNDTYLNYRHGQRKDSNTYKGIQYFYDKWQLSPEKIIKDQNNPFIKEYKNARHK